MQLFKSPHKIALFIVCLLTITLIAQQKPTTVKAPPSKQTNLQPANNKPAKTPKMVTLLYAETLSFDKINMGDIQVLRGDVQFKHDSMYMYCDSAYFYEATNSLDAFGNVRMEQGDTLFVYGDVLYYDGNTEIARLRNNVRLENKDVLLYTDSLNYNQHTDIGYFFDGGKIVDSQNELTSVYGQYSPQTKESVFQYNVKLVNPKYTLYSDTLHYQTENKIATILGPSTIVSDSNTIVSDRGWYNTISDQSELFNRSSIHRKGQILTGDTIFYNRKKGIGEAFGNMFLNDSTRKFILEGNYGFYNEITEYSFATKRAQAIEYSSQDTMFLHADTLKSTIDSLGRILEAYHKVRFYRGASQGVCDSLRYVEHDSLMTMYNNPILWNENYQVFGDTIKAYLNDSTLERIHIPVFAFVTEKKDTFYYDQITGKDLKAFFKNGDMQKVDVSGNVQTIFYPQEKDSTYIGLNRAESSFLTMYLKDKQMEKVIMWPEVTGSLTPMELTKPSQYFLSSFKWYEYLRPKDKYDIFTEVKRIIDTKAERKNNRFREE